MREALITRRLVLWLGLSQLVCWGVSYYLIALFGQEIAADLHASMSVVYGGFSAALIVMGVLSPRIGRAVDRHGGRPVMLAGSCLMAVSCLGLALSFNLVAYYIAWVGLGAAMRMTLYDAAFAALARIGGAAARGPISQITLLGGLASTVFWPIGRVLADQFGWRGALICYAGFAVLTVFCHAAIPRVSNKPAVDPVQSDKPAVGERRPGHAAAVTLYGLIVTFTSVLNSGMSAHMIGIMTGLGMAATLAVWVSTLRGVGQSAARLCEILFGRRLNPLALAMLAAAFLPISFVAGLASGVAVSAAIIFALLYGAGNGLLTIVRGTLPLALFDARQYGALVGQIITPGFFLSALAPVAYALAIERFGNQFALEASVLIAALTVLSTVLLWLRFRKNPKA